MRPTPLANRVMPDGRLAAIASRGTLMGNRGGRFHDVASLSVTGRPWASRQWIICVTRLKSRQRVVWQTGYTELFFCDEVTALAAGHRPCMECRRQAALAYRAGLAEGLALPELPRFPAIDRMLDAQRRDGRTKRLVSMEAEPLPDGVMIRDGEGRFLAFKGQQALLWGRDGYVQSLPRPSGMVEVLTPPASVAALRAGYQPLWHDTAIDQGQARHDRDHAPDMARQHGLAQE